MRSATRTVAGLTFLVRSPSVYVAGARVNVIYGSAVLLSDAKKGWYICDEYGRAIVREPFLTLESAAHYLSQRREEYGI